MEIKNLHGFSYISFILHADANLKLEFKNLSHYNSSLNLDYLSILENQGITYQDLKSAPEASDLKIHLENSKYPLYYAFHKGETAVLITVSRGHQTQIIRILQNIIDDFDLIVQTLLDEHTKNEELTQKNHSNGENIWIFFDKLQIVNESDKSVNSMFFLI